MHLDESLWSTIVTHHDSSSRWTIMMQRGGSARWVMITHNAEIHHDASRWFIVMKRHDLLCFVSTLHWLYWQDLKNRPLLASWCIVMVHPEGSSRFTSMIHHDALDDSSRWIIMVHNDESPWCIMMNHHASWWFIVMNHREVSWWFTIMNHHNVSWQRIMMNHHDASWCWLVYCILEVSWQMYPGIRADFFILARRLSAYPSKGALGHSGPNRTGSK